jgi:hypothetical protein
MESRAMRTIALMILLASTTTLPHKRPAARTVSSINYLGTYSAGSRVSVWRGENANIVVTGQLVDFSTTAEVTTSTGVVASGVSASLTSRVGGAGSHVTAVLGSRSDAATGDYQIRIHYAVEVNGPDRVDVRVFEKGSVSAIRTEEPATNGSYAVGQTVTLVATGSGLSHATFNSKSDGMHGITLVSIVSRSASEARFKIRIDSARRSSIGPWDLHDEAMLPSHPTSAQRFVAGYGPSSGGSDLLSVSGAIVPTIASVSPNPQTAGLTMTLSGTNLTPRGQRARLEFPRRYFATAAGPKLVTTASAGAGTLSLSAPSDLTGVDGRLFYEPDGSSPVDAVLAGGTIIPVLKVKEAPVLIDMLNDGTASHRKLLFQGSRALLGKHLFTETTSCLSTTRGEPISCTTTPTLPTVTFKNVQVLLAGASYSPTAQMAPPGVGSIIQGVDSLKLNVLLLPLSPTGGIADTATGTLTITTSAGSLDIPSVFYAPKPQFVGLDLDQGNGHFQLVTNQTLIREGRYRLRGNALNLVVGGLPLAPTAVTLNGTSIPATNSIESDGVHGLSFTVPAGATSGPLVVTTRVGSTTFGTMTVVNPVSGVSIAGMQLSPTSDAGGNTITATIAVNAIIPAGGSAGNLVFSASDSAVQIPTFPIAVTTNPVIVRIPTKPVVSVRSASITVRNEAASAVNSSATQTLALHPPAPTALTLANSTIAGGQSVTATIQLNADIAASANIPIALTSGDPTTATVPTSVVASGSSVRFTITTRVVPAVRTVTISATSDGQTRTATLTVNPPTVASLSLARTTSVAEISDTVTLTLTALPPAPVTATIDCADAALVCPPSITLSGLTTKFAVNSIAIPSARTVTIGATVNGIAKNTTLNLVPLAIQSLTMSPATVGAGTPSSMTLQLNAPSPSVTIQFTSSNTAVATLTSSQPFQSGQIAQLVTIATRSPQTQINVVTVTATLTRQTTFGTATSTATATLTVTP